MRYYTLCWTCARKNSDETRFSWFKILCRHADQISAGTGTVSVHCLRLWFLFLIKLAIFNADTVTFRIDMNNSNWKMIRLIVEVFFWFSSLARPKKKEEGKRSLSSPSNLFWSGPGRAWRREEAAFRSFKRVSIFFGRQGKTLESSASLLRCTFGTSKKMCIGGAVTIIDKSFRRKIVLWLIDKHRCCNQSQGKLWWKSASCRTVLIKSDFESPRAEVWLLWTLCDLNQQSVDQAAAAVE